MNDNILINVKKITLFCNEKPIVLKENITLFFFYVFFEIVKISSNNILIPGKVRCPYPGDPPHGRIAPLKFWYKPGDNIQVNRCLFIYYYDKVMRLEHK